MELRVKAVCREKGLTMYQLAERMGIGHVSLSKAVNGNATLKTLQKIADALDVPLITLFTVNCPRCGARIDKKPQPIPLPFVEVAQVVTPPQPQDLQLPDIGILAFIEGLKTEWKSTGKKNTPVRQIATLYNSLNGYSGETNMRSITTDYIEGFKQHMTSSGLSVITQLIYVERLNSVLALAKERSVGSIDVESGK